MKNVLQQKNTLTKSSLDILSRENLQSSFYSLLGPKGQRMLGILSSFTPHFPLPPHSATIGGLLIVERC